MKKNNRQQYLNTWVVYLKGKTQLDPKALADFLGETLKGALAPITMKRYTATVILNLYENGFLAGKTGKTFSGKPLEIVEEITLPVLDKCLTQNSKKIKFAEADKVAKQVEPVIKLPVAKKPRQTVARKKAALKPVKVKKPAARKPGPQKKKIEVKPKKEVFGKVQIVPGKKPERKPAAKKPGLIGRKTNLLKMGESAFLYSLELSQRVEEMERVIANYERVFEAVRQLFSREMNEIEEWLGAGLE